MSKRTGAWRHSCRALLLATAVLLGACDNAAEGLPGERERGRALAERAGCGSCHQIPGIPSAEGRVGPPLTDLRQRVYLAGVLPNNFENLTRWLAEPQAIAPNSAMPDLGLSREQARDIAAYLYAPD